MVKPQSNSDKTPVRRCSAVQDVWARPYNRWRDVGRVQGMLRRWRNLLVTKLAVSNWKTPMTFCAQRAPVEYLSAFGKLENGQGIR